MNQLVLTDDKGGKVLVFVIGPANVKLMQEGNPVSKHLEDFFPDGIPRKLEVLIYYSDTPVSDSMVFSKMAKIAFDERTPVIQRTRPHCPECKSTIEQLGIWRNESPMAIAFCPDCGCVFGMVPSEIVKSLSRSPAVPPSAGVQP